MTSEQTKVDILGVVCNVVSLGTECIQLTMPTVMCISTSHNKGIYATKIMQCAASCKWLAPGSRLVDTSLTGQVDACVNLPRV